jgi:hypothetical protein
VKTVHAEKLQVSTAVSENTLTVQVVQLLSTQASRLAIELEIVHGHVKSAIGKLRRNVSKRMVVCEF